MRHGAARRPATLAFLRCLEVAAAPTLAAALIAGLLAWLWPAVVVPGSATAAQSPWLLLPLLTAAGCCLYATLRLWPLFAQHRPGADWLRRWQRGPLRGLGAVTVGALLAQLFLTLPLTTVMARWLGAPSEVHASLRPHLPELPILQAPGQRLTASFSEPVHLRELRVRPRAGIPGVPFVPSRIEVRADGEPTPLFEHAYDQDRQLHARPLDARMVHHLELRLAAGSVPLWFDEDSIEGIGAAAHGWFGNGALAALLTLVPNLVAMALAMLAGATAALPTVALVGATGLFVMTLGAIGPLDAAVDALFRGRWLAGPGPFPDAIPFLAVACLAMIGRMLVLRRPTR